MVFRFLLTLAASMALASPAFSQESAQYRLDIHATWSLETHPFEYAPGAHFSRMRGATHNSRYTLFGDGRTASSGLQSVAERGRTDLLLLEMEDARERGRLGEIFDAPGIGVPGTMSATFTATEKYSLASFATMVAPSPDWFTGAASVPLFVDGKWVERVELTLWAWDAGTDSGTTWTADNAETQPRQSIRLLAAPNFLYPEGLRPVGTATMVQIEE